MRGGARAPLGRLRRPGSSAAVLERGVGWLLLLPAAVPLAVFAVGPMLDDVFISLHDRRLTSPGDPWTGLSNWHQLFSDGLLGGSVLLTVVYALVTVTVSGLLGLSLALYLVDRRRMRLVVGTLAVLPLATSLIIASAGWQLFFNADGAFNELLGWVSLGSVDWLGQPLPARVAIVVVGIWSQTGFAVLLYQASLSRLPASTVDAARVFAAWRGFGAKLRLVVPLLYRTTLVVVVVSTITALKGFDQIYALTQGGPNGATQTLAYLTYELSFTFYDLGQGAAAATLLLVLVLIVVAVQYVLLRHLRHEGLA